MKFFFLSKASHIESHRLQTAVHFLKKSGLFIDTDSHRMGECSYLVQYGGEPDSELTEKFRWVVYIPESLNETWRTCSINPLRIQVPINGWSNLNQGYPFLAELYHSDEDPIFAIYKEKNITFFHFDLIRNITTHLLRDEEAEYSYFHPSKSILANTLHLPVADILIHLLKMVIEEVSEREGLPLILKKRWPEGQPMWFNLSHDVDLTRKWGPKSFLTRGLPLLFEGKIYSFKKAFREALNYENSYWTFPELIEFYEELGWHATFFFLAEPWEGLSYRYNIRKKKFKDLFIQLKEMGHEIGLHTSKFSFGQTNKVRSEKHLLERCAGFDDHDSEKEKAVKGVRQHFLKCSFPEAFHFFQKLGFLYDSSMAYNELPGYRSGTSLPYLVFTDKKNAIWEFPFMAFEYHLHPDRFFEKLKGTLGVLEKIEGNFHFLFHPSNLAESGYRKIFHYLCDHFAGKQWNATWTIDQLIKYMNNWTEIAARKKDERIVIENTTGEVIHLAVKNIPSSDILGGKQVGAGENTVFLNLEKGQKLSMAYEV